MRLILPLLFAGLIALPCFAISPVVDNMDSVPHRLGIESIGGERREITIPPGERREIYDHEPTIVSLDDPSASPVRTNDDEEYCFWKGGRLLLQKYNFRLRGRGN